MSPLELRYDPNAAKYGLVIWPLVALVGFAIVITHTHRIAILLIAAIFVLISLCAAYLAWQRNGDGRVILRIGPDGIQDRRLGRHLIRWDQIIAIEAREIQESNGLRYLDLHLDKTVPVKTNWLAALWYLTGARGFTIADEGLNGSFNQIVVAAKYFADIRQVPCRI